MGENEQLQTREDAQREYVARIDTGGGSMSRFEPTDLPSLMDLSNMVARSGLCPKALQGKPQDVALVVMAGTERGLSTMQSLQNMHVIYGRVAMSADLIRAQCQRHPDCEHFELSKASPDNAVLLVKKKGWKDGVKVTWSIDDAKRAGLTKADSNWMKWPEDMNVARVTTRAARRYFPDVMAGIIEEQEARDIGAQEGEETGRGVPSAKAKAVAEKLKAAAEESTKESAAEQEEEIEEAEFVEAEPVRPAEGAKERLDAAAEEDAKSENDLVSLKKFSGEVVKVPTIGATGAGELVKRGYTSWRAIWNATEDQLTDVPRIGKMGARNLKKAASKHVGAPVSGGGDDTSPATEQEETAPPTEERAEEEPTVPPAGEGKPWGIQASPVGLASRPIFHPRDWLDGLKGLAEKCGATWEEVLAKAKDISGGYDPSRLTDKEWEQLTDWIATQEGLLDTASKGAAGPAYELVRDHEKYDGTPLSAEEIEQATRYSERAGVDWATVETVIRTDWGFELDAVPTTLRYAVLELASGGDYQYQEMVELLLERGVARKVGE